jgi:hypothetical protein
MARKTSKQRHTAVGIERKIRGRKVAKATPVNGYKKLARDQASALIDARQRISDLEHALDAATSCDQPSAQAEKRIGSSNLNAPQPPQSPIASAVERLQLELNGLTASLSLLNGGLTPVLRPAIPEKAGDSAEKSATCELDGKLTSIADGIRSTTDWIDSIRARLML